MPAFAANTTWTGAGSNNNWNNGSNWSNNAPNSAGTATLNNNTKTAISVSTANGVINNVLFDTANAGAFTIGGPFSLTLANGGSIAISSTVVNTETFNAPLILSATNNSTYSFTNNSTAAGVTLNIAGTVTGQDTAGNSTTLTIGGAGTTNVSGVISDGSNGGTVNLSFGSGGGTIQLNGVNAFSGGSSMDAADNLILGNKSALGTGTFSIGTSGGTVSASTDLSGANAIANAFSTGIGQGVTFSGTNNIEFTGTTTTPNGTITNNLSSNSVLTFSGPVNISNSNTNRTLTLGGSGDTVISGAIANGGMSTSKLAYSGTGTLSLNGTNTYTGTTTISLGTVLVNGNTSAATGAVTVSGNGTLLGGTGTIGGTTTIQANSGITGAKNGTVGTLSLNSNLTFTGSSGNFATYFVDLSGATSDKLAIGGTLNVSGALDQISFNGTADGTTTYVLATFGSRNGVFTSVVNLPNGYQLVYSSTELDLVPTNAPEPSTWFAAALALGAIGYSQRKRLRVRRCA